MRYNAGEIPRRLLVALGFGALDAGLAGLVIVAAQPAGAQPDDVIVRWYRYGATDDGARYRQPMESVITHTVAGPPEPFPADGWTTPE
jgi:hypothetical protein